MWGHYLRKRFQILKRRPKTLLPVAAAFYFFILGFILVHHIWKFGVDMLIRETPYSQFTYPLAVSDENFYKIVTNFRDKTLSPFTPTNQYYSKIAITPSKTTFGCENDHFFFLILVKSAPPNVESRDAIRATWKNEVSGITTKTLFFIGNSNNGSHQASLVVEEERFQDIVRIQYDDTYYNNTIKTVTEMRFAAEVCPNFNYVMLIDDDYYFSVRQLRQFTEEQEPHGERLYAGNAQFTKPLRNRFNNKFFIDLDEYPFDYFPKFVNAGNVLLSKSALLDIYYATFFVTPFRFDDVYVAICAKKMGIEPVHSERFQHMQEDGDQPREGLIAAHGYSPERLRMYWEVQKEAGFV
ncbi:beta-1,3-galactosyltransferase brn-like [Folsomia candida]|uniref:Hexosyltransferase n=1 Tax=Folsomia candida TaxID=158441 RepID=A0A226CZD7_FOLCA|nr:beta-1,3-galactosyltransferase brn-like [Folsomia candida]OXA37984.1 Beta-1,3-galactosyltransferase brn [Folsomia candida]